MAEEAGTTPSAINAAGSEGTTPAPAAAGQEAPGKGADEGTTPKAEDAKGDKAKDGAPEKYADFTFKDGIEVDKAAMEAFLPVAKKLNLSQEQAQELVNLQSEFIANKAKSELQTWETLQADWVKAAKTDKEIGGASFNDNVAMAAKAIKQFGTPELKQALDATGVGNHPEFIRVFAKVGKAISEDKFHVSNAQDSPTPKSLAERLFPNQGKQE